MQTETTYPPNKAAGNRVQAFLVHANWYAIEGQIRLARDCGVAKSTINRIVNGRSNPSYRIAQLVTDSLSKRLGVQLEVRDVFSTDGTYRVSRVCDMVPNCTGCFPDAAYDDDGNLRDEYRGQAPGDWCSFPTPLEQTSITLYP